MIVQGSMRYTTSGRKRKTNAYKKAKRPNFVAQKTKHFKEIDIEPAKQYTLAPAYNKGAYQVIPRGDVKWIGK